MTHKTLIIGAGPAGIAAAVQLKRVGEEFAILEKGEIGGLLLNANRVENYPGAFDSPSGPELVRRFKEHLSALKIDVISATIQKVELNSDGTFATRTENEIYQSKNLIVATGTQPLTLPNRILTPAVRMRLFYEVWPMRDLSGKDIIIIGGGDAAFDYALTLSKKNRVTIIYRSSSPKCHRRLYKEVSENPKISLIPNKSIETPCTRENPAFAGMTSGIRDDIQKADYILAAIGREPSVNFLSDNLKRSFSDGQNIPGLYFAGDVSRGITRQVAIAVGDGCRAAVSIKAPFSSRTGRQTS